MATREQASSGQGKAGTTVELDTYERLCRVADVSPVEETIDIAEFRHSEKMADMKLEKRLTAALQVFLDLAADGAAESIRIDKHLLDRYIAKIDQQISDQLDAVLHHPAFQEIESAWEGLKFLVNRVDFRAASSTIVELLDVGKDALREDFEDAPDTLQSGLYKHIYIDEYDTPGGEPVTAVVSNYEFGRDASEVALMAEVARVAAAAHCPFLGSVGAEFFGKASIEEVPKIQDLSSYMDRSEYIRWNSFRKSDDARYMGLVFPSFLLRLPYGQSNPVRSFNYEEQVGVGGHKDYLWGNATFPFAANMTRSFKQNGWAVNIRGPEAGGKVENLPIHHYDVGKGKQAKIPTEILISETQELEFAEQGFIPLSYYKNSDFACFFSANSTQAPDEYNKDEATANARINARLPYIFLVSRIAHYLKVLQRENIGSSKSRQDLQNELNEWLQRLVTKMKNPDKELIATHPLRDANVDVESIADNPGFYRVALHVTPHFQIEGVDVRLSLVAQMPTGNTEG